MTGTATGEGAPALAARLARPPLNGLLTVLADVDAGDGLRLLTLTSPLLDPDCAGCQEIVVDGDQVRFKPARDGDIGAGRAFDIA